MARGRSWRAGLLAGQRAAPGSWAAGRGGRTSCRGRAGRTGRKRGAAVGTPWAGLRRGRGCGCWDGSSLPGPAPAWGAESGLQPELARRPGGRPQAPEKARRPRAHNRSRACATGVTVAVPLRNRPHLRGPQGPSTPDSPGPVTRLGRLWVSSAFQQAAALSAAPGRTGQAGVSPAKVSATPSIAPSPHAHGGRAAVLAAPPLSAVPLAVCGVAL